MIRALGSNIFVIEKERESVLSSGIIIPDTAEDAGARLGEVVSVGPGQIQDDGTRDHMLLKVGDIVAYGSWAGKEVKHQEQTYVHIPQDNIIGVVRTV